MSYLVYIIGPPGAGKSALMAALTAGCERVPAGNTLMPHMRLIRAHPLGIVGAEMGRGSEQVPGTDSLPGSLLPTAKRWIMNAPYTLVLGEGDRLGFPGFMRVALDAERHITLVHVSAAEAVLSARRTGRRAQVNKAWCKDRAAKAENLAHWARINKCRIIRLNSTAAPAFALAQDLRDQVPILAALPEKRNIV